MIYGIPGVTNADVDLVILIEILHPKGGAFVNFRMRILSSRMLHQNICIECIDSLKLGN